MAGIKQNMKAAWMAGDFGVIARSQEKTEEEFIARLPIERGTRILDVACGTGNTAVPAARRGANVTGVDIATNLLAQGRERARGAGVEIDFREGDAEQLDFPDASFDLVVSVFGAMFAPRPDRVAAELLRVCRPGGMIAMGNWTPTSFPAKMFAVSAKHVPPPPGVPPAILWGAENVVRERLRDGEASTVNCKPIKCPFQFPFPPKDAVQLFLTFFGPTKVAYSKLDAAGQERYRSEMEELWVAHNKSPNGSTDVEGEFLEVHARRK